MRVAYICADAGIPVFGCKGASVHIQEVLRALVKKGAEIVLFASRIDSPPPPDLQGIQLCPLPRSKTKNARDRAEAAVTGNQQLVQALQDKGPFDLVYERYSLWSHAGLDFACRQGWKTVLEVNAPLIEEQRNYREQVDEEQASFVLRRLLDSAAAVVAVSPGVKDYLASFYGSAARVSVIANGVDPARFPVPLHPPLADIDGGQVVIGFLGTLKPWHGLTTLAEAFRLLHAQRPQTLLLIVGEGPERATLAAAFDCFGLSESVIFSGGVPPAEVPGWLAKMDIAVAPYPALAGFYFSPLKIYEYMAASLPVVTTRVGHLAGVVNEGQTGLLVEPDNPVALGKAIGQLVDNPLLRQQLGRAGRIHVTAQHSWDAVTGQILQIADIRLAEREP